MANKHPRAPQYALLRASGEGMKEMTKRSRERDPIEWAIIAVAISGSSLVLAISNKVDAWQAKKSGKKREQAVAANKVRLLQITDRLKKVEGMLQTAQRGGRIANNKNAHYIADRSIVFNSKKAEEAFNRDFTLATAAIADINQLLSEIDSKGLTLKASDMELFVTRPLREIQRKAATALQTGRHTADRLTVATQFVGECRDFVHRLAEIVSPDWGV